MFYFYEFRNNVLYSILKMPFNETLFYSFYFEFRFRILSFSKYRHLKEEIFVSILEFRKKKIICKFLFLDEGSISTSEVSKRVFSHFLRRKVLRISFER